MEQFNNEQINSTPETAAAEEKVVSGAEGEISLGKFKDVTALLNAYNSLQSEFTKRCQRIKELETNAVKPLTDKVVTPIKDEEKQNVSKNSEQDKEQILKEYLKDVFLSKPKAIVLDGVGVGAKTSDYRPKTIDQAGVYAKEILNKK